MPSSIQGGSAAGPASAGGIRIDRRSFLRAAGLTALAAAGGAPLLAATRYSSSVEDMPSALAGDRIGDLAAGLGYDVEAIFRFVSEQVRYEPYAGVLRGARGTLAGRAGNSADQALLLSALLEASLIDHRFAVGAIDSDTVDRILESATWGIDRIRQHAIEAFIGVLPAQPMPAPPPLDAAARALVDRADSVVAWADDELTRTVEMIGDSLASEGIDVSRAFTSVPELERSQHIWIQVDSGTEWIDLDPSLPGTSPGSRLADVITTSPSLADDLAHGVDLAVIAERVTGGRLSEEPLLALTERADVLAGQPLALFNVTPEGLSAMGVRVGASVSGLRSYLPALRVGDDVVVGHPFVFSVGDAAEGLLGSAFPEADTTALWLESTIRSPHAEPVVTRRALFDRVGPAMRAAGTFDAAALTRAATIDLDGGPPGDVVAALHSLFLAVGVASPGPDDPLMNVSVDDDLGAGSIMPATLHALREAAGQEVAVPHGVRPFPDAPNVHGMSISIRDTSEGPEAEWAVDIIHRSLGVAPIAGIPVDLPPVVLAGVLPHVVERVLMGDALAGPPSEASATSVGRLFESAAEAELGVRVLREPRAADDLGLPPDARAVLERSLSQGWIAIAPAQAILSGGMERAGWWLVDPATGRTVDQLDDGRGAVLVGDIITRMAGQLNAMVRQRPWLKFACVLAGAAAGAAVAIEATLLATGSWRSLLGHAVAGGAGAVGGQLLLLCAAIR